MKFSRLGRIFSFLFLGLASIATLIALFGSGGFEGIFLMALGLPWTLLFEPLVESLGYVEWYGQFSGSIDTVFLYSLFATLGLLPGVLINASILYGIGVLFDRASQQGGAGSPTTSSPRAPTGHAWRTFNIFFWLLLFLPLLFLLVPVEAITGNGATLYFFGWIGINLARIVLLSYFGYTIGQKKQFLLLGLLGIPELFSGFLGVTGMLIGYTVLRHARNKLIQG